MAKMLLNWFKLFPTPCYFQSSSKLKIFFHRIASKPSIPKGLLDAIQRKAEEALSQFHNLKQKQNVNIGSVAIGQLLSGLHGTRLLICETSEIDAMKGIYYRGRHIQDLVKQLPGAKAEFFDNSCAQPSHKPNDSTQHSKPLVQNFPFSEGLIWLLLSGELPDHDSILLLQEELYKRRSLPQHVYQILETLPPYLHPMTQFIIGVTACQLTSATSDVIRTGRLPKSDYWIYFLDDGLSLIAKASTIASIIYHRLPRQKHSWNGSKEKASSPLPLKDSLDWSANISRGLGFDSPMMANVMRLHMFLHADHEGGNVSAHAGHLVGSALSDPYLCFSASLTGLAGPLHGMANQTCLQFLKTMQDCFFKNKKEFDDESVASYVQQEYLDKKRVVPGFGHAVLRTVDPRFKIQHDFFKALNEQDSLGKLLNIVIRVVPRLLSASGKVSNPHPNIDAHSGVILNHYGISEHNFFTVLFGLSRSLGVVSQLVWDRILQLPIERPNNVAWCGQLSKKISCNFPHMVEIVLDKTLKSKLILLCINYSQSESKCAFDVVVVPEETSLECLPYIKLPQDQSEITQYTSTLVCLKWIVAQARPDKSLQLYNTRNLNEKANVDRWLIFASKLDFHCYQHNDLELLNTHLAPRTFLGSVSHFTLADMVLFASTHSFMSSSTLQQKLKYINLCRWFDHVQNLPLILGTKHNIFGVLFTPVCMDGIISRDPLVLRMNNLTSPTDNNSKISHLNNVHKDIAKEKPEKTVQTKGPKDKKRIDQNTLASVEARPLDDPTRLNIRVGRILKAWAHPDATKLYCFDVDVGEDKMRKIVSGIREYYTLEKLEGLYVLVLCNLKPKKLLGFESHGMFLCGKGQDSSQQDRIELVHPPTNSTIGERIRFEALEGDFDPVLSSKKGKDPFVLIQANFSIHHDGLVYYKDLKFLTSKGPCFCPSLVNGSVS